jgi:hypothetical protein
MIHCSLLLMDIDYKLPAAADEHREKSMMLLERQNESHCCCVLVDVQACCSGCQMWHNAACTSGADGTQKTARGTAAGGQQIQFAKIRGCSLLLCAV